MNPLLIRRRGMKGASAPAESFIEYLQATGSQLMALGRSLVRGATEAVIDCQYTDRFSTTQILFGVGDGAGQWFGNVGSKFGIGSTAIQKLGASNLRATVTITYGSNRVDITDGTLTGYYSNVHVPENPLYLFAVTSGYYSSAKVWSLKIYESGVLVADYRPYRIGSTGFMKEILTDTLIANTGSGDFILGPDIQ